MRQTRLETIKPFNSFRQLWLALPLLLISLALLGWVDNTYIVPLKGLDVPNAGNDFGVFWTGTRTVWQGGNPYLTEPGSIYRNILIENGYNLQPPEPYINPYYVALLILPLAALPLGLAATVWLVIGQLLLVVSIVLLIGLVEGKFTLKSLLLGLGLSILWRYTFLVMMVGNLSILLLFAITASYYCSRTGRYYLAGVLAALLLVKPQIAFLSLPLLLLVPIASKAGERAGWSGKEAYRRWAGFITVGFVFALFSFGLMPGWVSGSKELLKSTIQMIRL